jgi:hypothetical protein
VLPSSSPLVPTNTCTTTLPSPPHPHSALVASTATAARVPSQHSLPLLSASLLLQEAPQLPRPGSSLPSQRRPDCHWPAHRPTTLSLAQQTHTHSHTHKHIHVPLTKHTWTRTLTLALHIQQPQAKFPKIPFHTQNHTTPAFPALPGSIPHTSSDLHEPTTNSL